MKGRGRDISKVSELDLPRGLKIINLESKGDVICKFYFLNPKPLVSKNNKYWKENNLLTMRGNGPAA